MTPVELDLDLVLAALKGDRIVPSEAGTPTRSSFAKARIWVAGNMPAESPASRAAIYAIDRAERLDLPASQVAELVRAALTEDTDGAHSLRSYADAQGAEGGDAGFYRLLAEGDADAHAFAAEAEAAWERYHALREIAEGVGSFGLAVLLAALTG